MVGTTKPQPTLEGYAMENSTPSSLFEPDATLTDSLTELLRKGARELIAHAVESELGLLLKKQAQNRLPDGRLAVVRKGYLPERTIQTGIGEVEIKIPKGAGQKRFRHQVQQLVASSVFEESEKYQ